MNERGYPNAYRYIGQPRKCVKCGYNPTLANDRPPFHRFPQVGATNIERVQKWANFCWPDQDWSSVKLLSQLHAKNKVLCNKHFEDRCYTDSTLRRLSRYAVPSERGGDGDTCLKQNIEVNGAPASFTKHKTPSADETPPEKGTSETKLNENETTKNDIAREAITQAEVPLPLEDPLMVDQENAMDIDINDDDQNISEDHDDAEKASGDNVIPDYNVVSDSEDDYRPSDDQGDDDDESADDLPAQSARSTKLPITKDTTNLPCAKLIANIPTATTTTNLPTAKFTSIQKTSIKTAILPTPKPITILPTPKPITILPTAKPITIPRTAKLITIVPATKNTTYLSTAEVTTNIPTAKVTTNIPTAKVTTNIPTAKATSNVLIGKDTTNLPITKLTANTDMQPTEFIPPDKVLPITQMKQPRATYVPVRRHGPCRCCLKIGTHSVVNVRVVLECLNIEPSTDPRVSLLICSECTDFLRQARLFREMVAASERTLLNAARGQPLNPDSDETVPVSNFLNPDAETISLLVDDGKQEEIKMEDGPDNPGEITVPVERTPDDGVLEDRGFSQLSNYTDFSIDTKENSEGLTNEDISKMVMSIKKEGARWSFFIRENLITLLDCSTIVPFASIKGVLFDCIYCDWTFKHTNDLRYHIEAKHLNEENHFKHEILKIIPQSILRADISFMKCRLCDERFTTIDNLVEHLVQIHDKIYHSISTDPPHNVLCFDFSLDDWKCLTCEKIFPTFRNLRAHVNKHYGSFLCHECGSKFMYPNAYSKHMQHHRKIKHDKKHMCDLCGEMFKTQKDIRYHKNRNHNDDTLTAAGRKRKIKEPPMMPEESPEENVVFECVLCNNGTLFTSRQAAYMHRMGHLNNTRDGPFACDQCQYISPIKQKLRIHLQGHYGIKRYRCEFCDQRCCTKSSLSNHMNMHLNVRFQCPLCATTLSCKKHVRRHVSSKHPGVTVDFS